MALLQIQKQPKQTHEGLVGGAHQATVDGQKNKLN